MSGLAQLHALLEEEGGLLAGSLVAPAAPDGPGAIAAGGPRAAAAPQEYALLVEAIHEGYLLHYGEPRIFARSEEDLALLAGDRLYALGLERLVALGDVPAVVELADVIGLCALVHGRGEGGLAADIWTAGAHAVGYGGSGEHELAKALVRAGDGGSERALADLTARFIRD
jgi:hypothetical protein